MKEKRNQILAAVVVLQVVLAVVVLWPRQAARASAEPLLAGIAKDNISALTIVDPDGKELTLQRDMGSWVLPNTDSYPALTEKVDAALDKILAVTDSRLVTRTSTSHRALQVADDAFARKIVLTVGGEQHTLLLGSSPSYGATHVRLVGQDETYLVSDLTAWDITTSPSAWIDTTLTQIDEATVRQITVNNGLGAVALSRADGDSPWQLEGLAEGEDLDQTKVDSLVRSLASMRMIEPLGKSDAPAYGLASPLATAAVEYEGGALSVTIGAADAEGTSYAVRASTSAYVVSVSQYVVQSVIDASHESLLLQPTPEAPVAPGQ